ncbi:Peptidase family M28 [Parapedobacter luteus]|uniref:Peptidase family M28 n=1 Tax=Parapedobacter luteus TaxID=623280 RepID=A0A1T5FJI7_9SPHI|nr:M28 family peptidase [Parapedobacter luteus]SKB96340.1 Peptidase family M28 [Parapedobacter luteus]
MCRKFIAIVLFIVPSLLTSAQSDDTQYAKRVVKRLASPAFNGRGYAANGDKKAARFIAAEMKKTGVKPLFENDYFQHFELGANTFPGDLRVSLDNHRLTPGVDFIVWSGSPSVDGRFAVNTIKRSDLYGDRVPVSDIVKDGHFLLIDNRKPADESRELARQADAAILFLRNDADIALPGVIIYDDSKLTWSSQTKPSARPVIFVNQPRLDPQGISSIAITVESVWTPNYTTQNVAGIIPGTASPDSMIVVCAHYDHLGRMGKKTYIPGANDNASGTAFILDLARHYANHPPKYSMVFIAFSGEESGLLGSKAFVKNTPVDLAKIKFLINFDMVGTGDDGITVVNAPIFPEAFSRMTQLNDDQQYLKAINSRGESCNSDHCPFYQEGVPSFFIYTQGGIAAYHDIHDRASTLPFTAYVQLKSLIIDFFKLM